MAASPHPGPSRSPINRLAQHLRQHPLVGFYLLAFSLAWGMELLVLGL